jgi:hypothetical protein
MSHSDQSIVKSVDETANRSVNETAKQLIVNRPASQPVTSNISTLKSNIRRTNSTFSLMLRESDVEMKQALCGTASCNSTNNTKTHIR